jgi:hypothetical protein
VTAPTVLLSTDPVGRAQVNDGPVREIRRYTVTSRRKCCTGLHVTLEFRDGSVEEYHRVDVGRLP